MSEIRTEGLPHPDEFPIGSPESRAAARALLQSREKGVRRLIVVVNPANRPPLKIGDQEGIGTVARR